ncbi:hypothetical protein [Vitiosangium sp. GDMCC 1.1324]|uniref:hypothetical protein n=1 Tax=Vitiosangium sp. (strain GDMCC 1.1324) TaxID=2138576 RepID=UPI000D37F12B|nr:hypothetical protein [Vitiosangium sp. GDMCC 1.1324]PTL76720.1 hypothetical protein DAT35_48190 [Vitiosangium sp. GDMCC 1.1324]
MSTLQLPTQAVVAAWNPRDGVGTLRTAEGIEVRFGASACTDFDPEQGMSVWLVETQPDPLGRGERAKVVNRSGQKEKDRLSQIWEEAAASDARLQLEVEVLERLGLPEQPEPEDYEALTSEERVRLAEEVMALRRSSHLFEEAFSILVEMDPTLFHPYLGELSREREPESLAWWDAPLEYVLPLAAELRPGWHSQRKRLPVGTVMSHQDALREERAPGDPMAAAALALARSGRAEALRMLESWLATLETPELQEALVLLAHAGVVRRSTGKVVRSFSSTCLEVLPANASPDGVAEPPVAHGTLWNPIAGASCPKCGNELVDALLLDGEAPRGVPWPARLPTCFICIVGGGRVHVEVSGIGTVRGLGTDGGYPVNRRVVPPALQRVGLGPGRTWRTIFMSKRVRHHRLGGAPTWVQGPEIHACPRCGEPMSATAQVRDTDSRFSDTGMLYGVACEPCGIVSSFSQ